MALELDHCACKLLACVTSSAQARQIETTATRLTYVATAMVEDDGFDLSLAVWDILQDAIPEGSAPERPFTPATRTYLLARMAQASVEEAPKGTSTHAA